MKSTCATISAKNLSQTGLNNFSYNHKTQKISVTSQSSHTLITVKLHSSTQSSGLYRHSPHTQVAERVMASVPVFISGDKLTAGHVAPDSVRQEYGCCLCGVAVD